MILCLFSAALIVAACGGNDQDFDLTVINDPQSMQGIRVDLGGEVRALNFGDGTVFRMVRSGRHILSVESPTCAGTTRDTLMVSADLTVRVVATQDVSSGECRVQFSHSLTPKLIPLASASLSSFRGRPMAGHGTLDPGIEVRILAPEYPLLLLIIAYL